MIIRFRSLVLSICLFLLLIVINLPITGPKSFGEIMFEQIVLFNQMGLDALFLTFISTAILLLATFLLVISLAKYHGRCALMAIGFVAFFPPLINYIFF
ncbi:hypothetical protein AJ85_05610 [Alkalihalobacillus alcalophilus ATCC 27647 = CGMCC 1.3604]|uniref:Uncharacterized protein n=1 Tax=Alkalihalobacillus alcalophilus ATCC 27647 = CGMCC 1.3604 TaxID=1218173 RepID=A0A094WFD8_ALKAL|nr:hypothetical protein [Alkalihalobacillus alcalophilus]KGA96484.1 hypothetical protein BALCAV_0215925 [Alkalihalobacillus alcalophilus ATCC 27647 = CGMCC 1.3604]MED1562309.1 hypothetical protein [Alkalihalobacillus alcalophilus]THG88380.1 hypothetical protein AJ85_05610 [Alkalihalobacillus alcalophilus ATCC 27647 = CGMCC 1.3604]